MRVRYEVWRYSNTWGKWVRDIYPDADEAMQRYERLRRHGKTARPPRPFSRELSLRDRIEFLFSQAFMRGIAKRDDASGRRSMS